MKNLQSYDELFERKAGDIIVRFQKWTCVVRFLRYRNNDRTAIELRDEYSGEPVLIATVNIPTEKIEDDEVIIKNYSENEGILDVLVEAGIVGETIRTVETGRVTVPVVKLLVKPAYESESESR